QVKAGGNGKNNLVNINTATQAELEGLPNVGPATAKAIIEYREKNGGFKKVTDLMKITGIKQKTFDKIKDHICI
ncbi:ComEA family DNA-binding protein, partial [Ruminiclostridium cellobioparum]